MGEEAQSCNDSQELRGQGGRENVWQGCELVKEIKEVGVWMRGQVEGFKRAESLRYAHI